MPYVLAANDVGVLDFASIRREDGVERAFLPLLERLDLNRFKTWILDHFISLGGNAFRGLLVYDPRPPNAGVITRWENFDTQTYRRAFTAHVTTI